MYITNDLSVDAYFLDMNVMGCTRFPLIRYLKGDNSNKEQSKSLVMIYNPAIYIEISQMIQSYEMHEMLPLFLSLDTGSIDTDHYARDSDHYFWVTKSNVKIDG